EAASVLAVGEAARIIARGRADVMITGGADPENHPPSGGRVSPLEQKTHWRGGPPQAGQPGAGPPRRPPPRGGAGDPPPAGRARALARGARVYGEVLGFGSGCDARPGGGIDPEGVGTEIALKAALRDAGLGPAEVGHVNAHGAATRASDLAEARAIRRVFGADARVPVTALNGHRGTLVAGGGAAELVGSLLGVNRGAIPAVLNCDEPDPECALDLVLGATRPSGDPTFLKTSLTRHGQAAALVVRGNPAAD